MVQVEEESGKKIMFCVRKCMKNIRDSHVHGRAASANHAAFPPPCSSHIQFDWFEAAGNVVGMENRWVSVVEVRKMMVKICYFISPRRTTHGFLLLLLLLETQYCSPLKPSYLFWLFMHFRICFCNGVKEGEYSLLSLLWKYIHTLTIITSIHDGLGEKTKT